MSLCFQANKSTLTFGKEAERLVRKNTHVDPYVCPHV